MLTEHGIHIGTNYTLTRANDETLLKILAEKFGLSLGETRAMAMAGDEFTREARQHLAWIMRNYRGEFRDELKVDRYHNLIPSTLRNSLATLISGTTVAPTFKANYLALGTGSTAPANTDTQLQTETVRGAFTNRTATNNTAYLDEFFSTSQVAGNTYIEAGIFVDGTATANSGYLLSRVAISVVVAANENLTVNSTITIS